MTLNPKEGSFLALLLALLVAITVAVSLWSGWHLREQVGRRDLKKVPCSLAGKPSPTPLTKYRLLVEGATSH